MDIFSNLQVIGECLLDKKRVQAFEKAVNEVVKPGDVVLDVGTGSGIIALIAAKAGARKVYAVEIAEDVAMFAKKNIKATPYSSKIEVVNSDIRDFGLNKSVDVVTAELLDTCLVAEHQAVALNYLRGVKIIDENTKLIPYRVDCAVQAVEYDFNFYGFNMPFTIQARNYGVNEHISKLLSDLIVFKQVTFNEVVNTSVNETVVLKIKHSGVLQAVRLKSKTYLSNTISLWGTSDMNMPVIVPVAPIKVNKGDRIAVSLKYRMSDGFDRLTINIEKLASKMSKI